MEYWFDPRHTGALRVIDTQNKKIHGSDPQEVQWSVPYVTDQGGRRIEVDFATKRTHHGRRILVAAYEGRRNVLHWSDGNKWLRVRHNPKHLRNFF